MPDGSEGALVSAIAWLYLLTNAMRAVTYVPQILLVWRCRDGARTVSLLTWVCWTVSNVFTLLYGLVVLVNLAFALIALVNVVGCGTVVAITAQRRRQWRLAGVQRTLPASQGSTSLPPYCSTR